MTQSRRWVRGAVWFVLLVAGSVLARAQEVSGSISGTIIDPAGAGVSGAVVTLTDIDRTHLERTLKTDKAGFYMADSLPLGNYSVSIAMKGFKTATVTGIVLHAHDELKVDQKLVAGAAAESVATVAPRSSLNLKNGMSAGLITTDQVTDMVLPTRNYEQLIVLQPGVAYNTADQLYGGISIPGGTSNQVAFSINGQRPAANDWTIDGADNVNRGGNPALPGGDGGLSLLSVPSVDAISEVVTLRGTYEAEYGRNSSGQIDVISRSGTKTLHGGAYEFFRNNALDAKNFFSSIPPTHLRYNDFGFTLGGPVVIPHLYHGKDKTFFFYSQEFRRVVDQTYTVSYVPTPAELAGTFTGLAVCQYGQNSVTTGACNASATPFTTGTLSKISPTAQAYVTDIYSKLPSANPYPGQDPHALNANLSNVYNDAQEFARIDHALGNKSNIFFRYLHDSLPSTEGAGLFATGVNGQPINALPGVQTTSTKSPGTSAIGHMTVAVHPTFLADFGYAYSSGTVHSVPVGLAASSVDSLNTANIASTTTLPYTPTSTGNPNSTLGVVPSLAFSTGSAGGAAPTGISTAGIYNSYSRNHNGFGSLTKVYKEHTFKFGASYNHYQNQQNAPGISSPYPQGLFTFGNETAPTAAQLTALGTGITAPNNFDSTWASFLAGNAANGTAPGFQQGSNDLTANLNYASWELYLQDNWRATRRLTVNLGVRYSYFGQPYDNNGHLSNFDPALFHTVNQPTIDSNGQLCTTASQSTYSLSTASTTSTGCLNVNELNTGGTTSTGDPLNGIILGDSLPVLAFNNATLPGGSVPSTFTHGSPFGLDVGHAEKHDWAPRVGLALDVRGDGKTVVRGGYGIAYDANSVSAYDQEIFNNIPYVVVTSYAASQMVTPGGNISLANLTPPTLYGTPVNYQTPYAQQFSVDLQQVVTPTLKLDIGYFGDHGDHLLGRVDINEAPPGLFQADGIAYNGSGFRSVNLGPVCTSTTSTCEEPIGTSSTYAGPNLGDLACGSASSATCFYNVFNPPTNCGAGFVSGPCENPLNQIRPYPGYSSINALKSSFNSNYNSLQVKVTKRFSGRSMLDANYTWSKGLTNAPDPNVAAQNTYNLEPEYGRSSLDRNNILAIDGIWDLPWYRDQKGFLGMIAGGWELSSMFVMESGLPLTATMTAGGTVNYAGNASIYNPLLTNGGLVTDSAGLGIIGTSSATLRPNQVLNPNYGYGVDTVHKRLNWFNRTAFIAPSQTSFAVGNERRGVINGPGFNRVDFAAFRSFKLYKALAFQVRGEAFNVLNHPSWAAVSTNATSSNFGQVTSAHDPRIVQVGGKLSF